MCTPDFVRFQSFNWFRKGAWKAPGKSQVFLFHFLVQSVSPKFFWTWKCVATPSLGPKANSFAMEPGNRTVTIDVGGERIIKVSTDLFSVAGDNKFSSLFSGRWENQLDADGKLFVDYSPQVFLPLIEFLRVFRDSKPEMLAPVVVDPAYRSAWIQMMLAQSFHVSVLRKAGVTAEELKDCGCDAQHTQQAGFTGEELRQAGFTLAQLQQAGLTAKELRLAGFTVVQLQQAGLTDEELRQAGFTAAQLRQAGFTLQQLRQAGFTLAQLEEAGLTVAELRQAGFTAAELRQAGFTLQELQQARIAAAELLEAKFTFQRLLQAGFTISELRQAGFTAAELRQAWFTPQQLRQSGFTAAELRQAGFTAAELRQPWSEWWCTVAGVRQAGFTLQELQQAGFTAAQLRQAGFTGEELRQAGFTLAQLQQAGFTAAQLRQAGFTAAQLRQAGFTLQQLRQSGFTVAELRQSGFTLQELQQVRFTVAELRQAGFTVAQLLGSQLLILCSQLLNCSELRWQVKSNGGNKEKSWSERQRVTQGTSHMGSVHRPSDHLRVGKRPHRNLDGPAKNSGAVGCWVFFLLGLHLGIRLSTWVGGFMVKRLKYIHLDLKVW